MARGGVVVVVVVVRCRGSVGRDAGLDWWSLMSIAIGLPNLRLSTSVMHTHSSCKSRSDQENAPV